VCELPYYTAPALDDTNPAGRPRRAAVLEGLAAAEAIHAEVTAAFRQLGAPPDHRLTRSLADYVRKVPKRVAAERAHAARPEFDREATGAEVCDASSARRSTTCLPGRRLPARRASPAPERSPTADARLRRSPATSLAGERCTSCRSSPSSPSKRERACSRSRPWRPSGAA
jgi:hypothetical protein